MDRSELLHGAGVRVDRCPDLFVVLEDGVGYVYDDGGVFRSLAVRVPVPAPHEDADLELCALMARQSSKSKTRPTGSG